MFRALICSGLVESLYMFSSPRQKVIYVDPVQNVCVTRCNHIHRPKKLQHIYFNFTRTFHMTLWNLTVTLWNLTVEAATFWCLPIFFFYQQGAH